MRVLAVDPGNVRSAWVLVDCSTEPRIHSFGLEPNQVVAEMLFDADVDHVVIEMVASYGMPVGKTVFDTCVWIGRFFSAVDTSIAIHLIRRPAVKLEICGQARAKDSNIRQAMLDRWGEQGTKKNPGPTYGFKKDLWAALAVACAWIDRNSRGEDDDYQLTEPETETPEAGGSA